MCESYDLLLRCCDSGDSAGREGGGGGGRQRQLIVHLQGEDESASEEGAAAGYCMQMRDKVLLYRAASTPVHMLPNSFTPAAPKLPDKFAVISLTKSVFQEYLKKKCWIRS